MARPGYSLQLDGLRGIAILMVFLHHTGWKLPHVWDWGQMGIRIFFVLTGYLITLSLWKLMERVRRHSLSHRRELLIYHLRRFARLLPAFYASLLLGYALGLDDVLSPIWWHLTFLTNFKIAAQGYWFGPTANFWSLAMQEQFYLIWPLLVLWTPRRQFPMVAILCAVGAYGYRVFCMEAGIPVFYQWLMLPGSMDSFALGGLLAWWKRERGLAGLTTSGVAVGGGWAVFWVLWTANRVIRFSDFGPWIDALPELLEALCAVWLVAGSASGWRGMTGKLLSLGWLGYLGRISYGIFVYHLILLYFFESHFARFAIDPNRLPIVWSASMLAVTVGVASISYALLELPILRWARREQKHLAES